MASLSEVESIARDNRDEIISLKAVVQAILDNTVIMNRLNVDINDANVPDKTGLFCQGQKAGINEGAPFGLWRSTVSDPTTDDDFDIKMVSQ